MAKIEGHVDGLGRPLIAIVSAATGDPFLATVDTGFNGALLVSTRDAATIGVRPDTNLQQVELADGRKEYSAKDRLSLEWLGATREIEVFISDDPSRGGDGRPVALIGARLLAPHLLLVDYGAATVEIESQA